MHPWLLALLQALPVILILLYLRDRRKHRYWSDRGVPGPPPWPFVGNLVQVLSRGVIECDLEWTARYGPLYGHYYGTTPVLSLSDPTLIKQVMCTDFGAFMNRPDFPNGSPIDRHSLFNLVDEHWRRVRAITSPSFSTGKLRAMHPLIDQCIRKLITYLDEVTDEKDSRDQKPNGATIIEAKQVLTGFTIDVIAATSFATDTDANRNSSNPFVEEAKKRFRFPFHQLLAMMLLPRSVRRLTHWLIPPHEVEKETTFFHELATQIVRRRRAEQNKSGTSAQSSVNKPRVDLVQLLLDASLTDKELSSGKADFSALAAVATDENAADETVDNEVNNTNTSKRTVLTDPEVIASGVLFFVAGFETTASALTNTLFELASNPEEQAHLHSSLAESLQGLSPDSADFHETVLSPSKQPYLEAVVKETLRRYPPLAQIHRRVGVDGFELAGIRLAKDQIVMANAWLVHHDPRYFPEPDRWRPRRWMEDTITPNTYMPFGQGPRNCIGMRFAYQELKLCLARLVLRYRFEVAEGTPKKLPLGKVMIQTASNFPLRVVRRD